MYVAIELFEQGTCDARYFELSYITGYATEYSN
jgi:hypothetical protein